MQLVVGDGIPEMEWIQATVPGDPIASAMLARLDCRLDMNFLRKGKDLPPAPEAGKAPDRVGVMFTYPYAPIQAGDRIIAIPNNEGKIPVAGSFEIRAMPDEAIDFSDQHHIEVQVIETNQTLSKENWPTEEPEEDAVEVPDP